MSLHFQACALSSPLKSKSASGDMHCPGVPNGKKNTTIDQHCDITWWGKKICQALWASMAFAVSQMDPYTLCPKDNPVFHIQGIWYLHSLFFFSSLNNFLLPHSHSFISQSLSHVLPLAELCSLTLIVFIFFYFFFISCSNIPSTLSHLQASCSRSGSLPFLQGETPGYWCQWDYVTCPCVVLSPRVPLPAIELMSPRCVSIVVFWGL